MQSDFSPKIMNKVQRRDFQSNSALKLRYSSMDMFNYLVLIAFLHPGGFSLYFERYKNFFTSLLYLAMVVIVFLFGYNMLVNGVRYKKTLYFIGIYYIVFICITLYIQGGIDEGLQKVFAAPALFIFCFIMLQNNFKSFLRCLANILIVLFTLNITCYNPVYWPQYFNAADLHMIFIGHVQVAAQLGIIGLWVSYLIYRLNYRYKSYVLTILSVVTLLMSQTAAAAIVLVFILFAYLMIKFPYLKSKWLQLNSIWYVIFFVVLNAGLMWIVVLLDGNYRFNGVSIAMNGRMFIWAQVGLLILQSLWIGYGVQGVLIKVFWSQYIDDGKGMNYAHNEILQQLLDGGIVLLVLFIWMLVLFANYINKVRNAELKKIANLFLMSFFLIMIIESVFNYYYITIFLSILAFLPEIADSFPIRVQADDMLHSM